MRFAGIPFWAIITLIAGSASVLAILHLLRVRPREVRVVTTLFWLRTVEQPRARTLSRRFRHPWTFALLALICALLSAALGEPHGSIERADRIWEVIVLDGGASMAAPHTTAGTCIEAAREAVWAEAKRLSLNDRLAIIVADPWPRLVHRFGDPRPIVRQRLRDISPAAVPAAQSAAIRLAHSLLLGKSNPRVIWITDRPTRAASSVDGDLPTQTQVVGVGEPANNAGILSAVFEPDANNPLRGRFGGRLGYWGDQPRQVEVSVRRAGGAPLWAESRRLAPGDIQDFVVADLPADGDEIIVDLSPPDAVTADDQAVFQLPLRVVTRVGLEEPLPAALRIALESNPSIILTKRGEERDIDVIVGRQPSERVRPAISVAEGGALLGATASVRVVGKSPLTTDLDFEGAFCGSGASLDGINDNYQPLLAANDAVLAAISFSSQAPCLYLAPALVAEDSSACRRGAFAVLVARALRHFSDWDELPVALTPERAIEDPLWCRRVGHSGNVITLPGSRRASDLSRAASIDTPAPGWWSGRWSSPAPFEILLALALALFVVEAVLHIRGRIP